MTVLNTADKIYLGALEADRVYAGATQVWPADTVEGPTHSLLLTYAPGAERNDFTGEVGTRLQFADARTYSWLGVRAASGNSGLHTVTLYDWFTQAVVRTASVDLTGVAVGDYGWAEVAPFSVAADSYYALLATQTAGGQMWANEGAATYKQAINHIYATYRSGGGAFNVTSLHTQFVGVDVGWTEPVFAPTDISGLAVWHDASQLALADGANVTAWPNEGTATDPVFAGTPLPTYKTNATPSGGPAVRFAGNGAGLRGDVSSIYSPGFPMKHSWTVIYVARRWGALGGRCFTAPYPEGENVLIGYHTSGYDCMHQPTGWIKTPAPFSGTPPDPWKLYSATDQESVGVYFYINGIVQAPLAVVSAALNYYYNINGYYRTAGGAASTAGEGGDFDVAELLIYDRCLTLTERVQVETYLRTKWGL